MKNQGIERVWENAGTWSEQALQLLAIFICKQKEEFTMEDFRLYASLRDLPNPHHENCWGALASKAAKQFLIKATGNMTQAKRSEAHSRYIRTWIRT